MKKTITAFSDLIINVLRLCPWLLIGVILVAQVGENIEINFNKTSRLSNNWKLIVERLFRKVISTFNDCTILHLRRNWSRDLVRELPKGLIRIKTAKLL